MKDNFSGPLADALDEEYMGKFPKSARVSLEQMRVMINDSESPADVALALSVGLAFVLCASKKPDNTLGIILSASKGIAERLMRYAPDGVAPAGKEFFEELGDRMDAMEKKDNLQ